MKLLQDIGLSGHLLLACGVAAIGSGFQHGYNTGVINAPQKIIEDWMSETISKKNGEKPSDSKIRFIWSLAVSIYCIGGVLGGLLTSTFAIRLGRKGGLLVNNIFAIIAAILMGCAKMVGMYELFIIGRFFSGFNCGLNSGLAAMYLVEISPKSMRGAIGTIYQLIITISILISQVLGSNQLLGTNDTWPSLFGLIGIVALLQCILLPLCPETPKHCLNKGENDRAEGSLKWLRSTQDVSREMREIKAEAEQEKSVGKAGFKEFVQNPSLRKPLIVSIVIMLAQQLSGINAVIYYSTETFSTSGLNSASAQYATMGMGAMNILMTLVSLFLVDIAGRKTLLLVGFGSMFIDTVLLSISLNYTSHTGMSYLCVALVLLFVVCFATGPGSIPWFIVAELFGQEARPFATSISIGCNWMANFLVGLLFLPLKDWMDSKVFVIFAILQLIFFVFIYFKVPETKNKSLEEVLIYFK